MEENLNVVNDTQGQVVDAPNTQAEATEQAKLTESASPEAATEPVKEAEKPVQSKEDNAKFAEMRRKHEAEKVEAEKAARDKVISDMYGATHGIHTYDEYLKAMELAKIKENKSYTDEEAAEIYEARQIKELKAKEEAEKQAEQSEKERREADIKSFCDYFMEENGRQFDHEKDTIPQEVWDKVTQGEKLKYAYIEYQLKQIKQGLKTQQKNIENATASVGSVKSDGIVDSDFISAEEFETKRSDQRWVMKNLEKLNKSRLKW